MNLLNILKGMTIPHHTVYKMQMVGPADNTVRTSIPRCILENQAILKSTTVDDLIKNYRAEWRTDTSGLVLILFVPKS